MSSMANPQASDRMYSKLVDNEASYDEFSRVPEVQQSDRPAFPVRGAPWLSNHGPYRLATMGLAVLCAILLISIIAVAAHYKNKPQGGSEGTWQMQKQDTNVSALMVSISKLQTENERLKKEIEELQGKVAARMTTKVPPVIKPTPGATLAPIVCPVGWQLFGSSCYLISRQRKTWSESQHYCQSQGGHLAIILTAEEQTFLWDRLTRGHWNSYWFGITDGQTEDEWKWVDGTPLVGGFWEVGEPNNHINEDCGYIVKTQVLERVAIRSWFDAPCEMSLPFICEKEMVSAGTSAPH